MPLLLRTPLLLGRKRPLLGSGLVVGKSVAAFGSTPVIDDFNAGAAQLLTARAGWDAVAWLNGGLITDAAPTYAVGNAGAVYTGNTVTAPVLDGEFWATYAVPATETYIVMRWLDNNNYYSVNTVSAAFIRLAKKVAGSSTTLDTTAQAISAGDSVGLRCIGSTISSWYKPAAGSWTQIFSVTDAGLPGIGKLGIQTFNTIAHYDRVGGGAVS